MYHPSTRLLTILELLQARGKMGGAELARRLEVSPRSVRRYVMMLQDMGIPVEGERGRYGQYRLRAGYKLPPLMFTDDEALALTVGLLQVRQRGGLVDAATTEGALAKLDRVLPDAVRRQVAALQATLVLGGDPGSAGDSGAAVAAPISAKLAVLSQAVQAHRRTHMSYLRPEGGATEREFDPYSIVERSSIWYTVGFCQLRQEIRTFRLDRIGSVELREAHFTPPEPFDALAYVTRAFAMIPALYTAEVLLETTLERAQREVVPAAVTLEVVPEGVLMSCTTDGFDWLARLLARLSFPWQIRTPAALKTAVAEHAAMLLERVGEADAKPSRRSKNS